MTEQTVWAGREVAAGKAESAQGQDERVLLYGFEKPKAGLFGAIYTQNGFFTTRCTDTAALCSEIETGAGVAVIEGRKLKRADWFRLSQVLARQPTWSDFPLIILTQGKDVLDTEGLDPNPAELALFLDVSASTASLLNAVRVSLRNRRRQYELRDAQKRLQAEGLMDLRQLHTLAEQRVTERTQNLQESLQSLEGVLYHVAHDLRAPLRSMQGFTTILMEEFGPQLGAEGGDYARRISGAASRMDKLIQDLLAYGRLAHTKLSPATVELNRQIKIMLGRMTKQIEDRRVIVRVGRSMPGVCADPQVFDQVLTQLVNNAMTFVGPGVRPKIHIQAETREAGLIRISVQDNGLGIALEHHERIFRVFERLQTGDASSGTGIGLAIVRKGAERMGGSAGVESKLGAGSCFWVDLPAAPKN